MEKRELLKLENVSFAYRGGKRLFNSLSMTFRAGEFTVLTGPNGSGKSTLLLLGCGILRPEKGRVLLNGEDLLRIPAQERAKHLAVTFQLASRSLPFRVRDLVMLGRLARRKWYEPYSAEDRAAAERSLEALGMRGMEERFYNGLSGGEKQRVLLASALTQEPELLLLDEPASALDFNHRCILLRLLDRLAREKNIGIVMISHDLDLSARFARRMVLMREGAVFADGTPAEVITPENIRRCYGCPAAVIRGPGGEPLLTVPAE